MRSLLTGALLALCLHTASQAGIAQGSKDIGAVWFIGDSITQSNADGDANGSPRKSLYDLLTANAYTFSYTGHYTNNVDGLPTTGATPETNLYQYHSGVSGSVIGDNYSTRTGMTQNTPSFWTSGRLATVKPGVIIILLGTNDTDQNIDLANAPARLSTLLDTIYSRPGIGSPTILVGSIPPNRTNIPTDPDRVTAFNQAVPGVVANQRSLGRDVHFVDQFTPINNAYATNMVADNLHPNATGNNTMAQQWYAKIQELVDVGPSPISVTGENVSADTDNSTAQGMATAATYTSTILTTDLINAGQSSLSSVVLDKLLPGGVNPGLPALNDGSGHAASGTGTGLFLPVTFGSAGKMPFTCTVTLDTSVNTAGYRIGEIRSIAGWNQNGSSLANQKYEVLVKSVGSSTFTSLGTFTYAPFGNSDTTETGSTRMTVAHQTGTLATGVAAIQFVFQDHGFNNGNLAVDGTVYQEIDVTGNALPVPPPPVDPPIPSGAGIVATGVNTSAETTNTAATGYPIVTTYRADVSATDLINASQSSLTSVAFDKTPFFTTNLMNDGTGHPLAAGGGTFLPGTWGTGNKMPFTYTAILNTSVNTLGYRISEIRSFAGWNMNGAALGNQKYEVLVSTVDSPLFFSLGTFEYSPFDNNSTQETSATKVILAKPGGIIATRVDAIRFVFLDPGYNSADGGPSPIDGTVYHEIDVIGTPATSGFDSWAEYQGVPATANGDSDRDGIPSLMEYALGYSPTKRNTQPALTDQGTAFHIQWPRGAEAAADPTLSYAVRVSENLTTWVAPEAGELEQSTNATLLKLNKSHGKRFGRLEISRTTP